MSASAQQTVLLDHVLKTYNTLRLGMGIIALVFPFALIILGYFFGVGWKTSMSAYYFAPLDSNVPPITAFPIFATRVLFSGPLFALGTFLYLYKGFSSREDWLLNAAGVFACLVALCPMSFNYGDDFAHPVIFKWLGYGHYTFALSLFACMACTVWFCANNTLQCLRNEEVERKFRHWYKIIAIAMGGFPIVALLLSLFYRGYFILLAEMLGVFTFAIYWLVKSWELRISDAEKQLLNASLQMSEPIVSTELVLALGETDDEAV
jgi:hypothetical protein